MPDVKKAPSTNSNGRKLSSLSNADRIIRVLSTPGTRLKFAELAKKCNFTRKELDTALPEARKQRPDLIYGKFDRTYWLSNTPTWYSYQTDLSQELPVEGEIGCVSDTHLCSVADRLDILNYAYDTFVSRGIKHVFHSGDMTDGWKEYRHHINFVKVHGDQEQAKYVIEKYPYRDGITTYLIGGNHDDSYGASKIDRLSLVVNGFHHNGRQIDGRKDMKYLGQYSHYIIFPQEVRLHMLHPRGSNAYALSYKQQKRAEAMPKNERPDIQVSGHYHAYCHVIHDGTQLVAMPGMQDETDFSKRLGLSKSLGFCILRYNIRRGRIASFAPEVITFS